MWHAPKAIALDAGLGSNRFRSEESGESPANQSHRQEAGANEKERSRFGNYEVRRERPCASCCKVLEKSVTSHVEGRDDRGITNGVGTARRLSQNR